MTGTPMEKGKVLKKQGIARERKTRTGREENRLDRRK